MRNVTIIDYGCGNVLSLYRAIQEIGFKSLVTKEKSEISKSDLLILPGVGAFGNAMNFLKKYDLVDILIEQVKTRKKPLIGICLGMQLLLSKSYEIGEHEGLNFIEGIVIDIKKKTKKSFIKTPHIKWNKIFLEEGRDKILNKNLYNKDYYFIHSFIAETKNRQETLAFSKYCDLKIPAIINKDNILGFQFHPEKSGKNGLMLLKESLKFYN